MPIQPPEFPPALRTFSKSTGDIDPAGRPGQLAGGSISGCSRTSRRSRLRPSVNFHAAVHALIKGRPGAARRAAGRRAAHGPGTPDRKLRPASPSCLSLGLTHSAERWPSEHTRIRGRPPLATPAPVRDRRAFDYTTRQRVRSGAPPHWTPERNVSTESEACVESLDHPVDNAPVRSLAAQGADDRGLFAGGRANLLASSRDETGLRPRGPSPGRSWRRRTGSCRHTHLDHIAALPVLVARRRMMKMEPPTIYLPAEASRGWRCCSARFSGWTGAGCRPTLVGSSPATRSSFRASWSSRRSPPSTRFPRSAFWSGSAARSSSPSTTT